MLGKWIAICFFSFGFLAQAEVGRAGASEVEGETEKSAFTLNVKTDLRKTFLEAHANEGKLRELESFSLNSTRAYSTLFELGFQDQFFVGWRGYPETSSRETRMNQFLLSARHKKFFFDSSFLKMQRLEVSEFESPGFNLLDFRSDIKAEWSKALLEYSFSDSGWSSQLFQSALPRNKVARGFVTGLQWDSVYLAGDSDFFTTVPSGNLGDDENLNFAHLKTYLLFVGYGWSNRVWKNLQVDAFLKVGAGLGVSKFRVTGSGAEEFDESHLSKLIAGKLALRYFFGQTVFGFEIESGGPEFETRSLIVQQNDHQVRLTFSQNL